MRDGSFGSLAASTASTSSYETLKFLEERRASVEGPLCDQTGTAGIAAGVECVWKKLLARGGCLFDCSSARQDRPSPTIAGAPLYWAPGASTEQLIPSPSQRCRQAGQFCSRAESAVTSVDMRGQVVLLTGGTGNLGQEVARALCKAGAHVVLACRSVSRGREAATAIIRENSLASLSIFECDLASFASIRAFTDRFLDMGLPLHVLINAASFNPNHYSLEQVCSPTRLAKSWQQVQLSEDGYEMNFAVGYLGHFLLTELLLPKLQQTAFEEGDQTRVINVCPHYTVPPIANSSEATAPHVCREARNASLSLALHAAELARRLTSEDPARRFCPLVTVNACVPENLPEPSSGWQCSLPFTSPQKFQAADDALAPVLLASRQNVRDVSGQCFRGTSPCHDIWSGMHLADSARNLYDSSMHMVGLAFHGSPRHVVPLSR